MADEPSLDSLIGSRARDENGRFVSVTPTEEPKETKEPAKAETQVEPAIVTPAEVTPKPVEPVVVAPVVPVESDKERAYQTAMQEERRKRQALEAQLRELQQPKKDIDPWTDLPGALKSEREQIQETLFVERCNLTAELARSKHADYDAMQAAFLEAAEADPSLFARLRQERNPAEFAYKHGLLHRELGSVNGDPVAYRAKLEADIRTKVEAEFAAKHGIKPATPVPTSLNSDSSPAVKEPVYEGPPPLASILRNAKSRS
jgi:hypothetical protein